jgi:hypothetical protein
MAMLLFVSSLATSRPIKNLAQFFILIFYFSNVNIYEPLDIYNAHLNNYTIKPTQRWTNSKCSLAPANVIHRPTIGTQSDAHYACRYVVQDVDLFHDMPEDALYGTLEIVRSCG